VVTPRASAHSTYPIALDVQTERFSFAGFPSLLSQNFSSIHAVLAPLPALRFLDLRAFSAPFFDLHSAPPWKNGRLSFLLFLSPPLALGGSPEDPFHPALYRGFFS